MALRTLSPNGVEFLKKVEGVKLKMYVDPAGYPTIGIGHKLTPQEMKAGLLTIHGVTAPWRKGLTLQQAETLKAQDAGYAESALNVHVKAPLTQSQFDALVSFVFNVGVGAFLASTLLKRLNAKQYEEIPKQFKRWVYLTHPRTGKKVRSVGMVNRRNAEIALWHGATA